jgi:transcriptional regulator with XRE-family HTH domain
MMSERLLIDGRKLAAIRRDLYLTQDELAQKLEMSAANVRRIEQSEVTGMQVKNFRRLATLLNTAPDPLRARIGVNLDGGATLLEPVTEARSKDDFRPPPSIRPGSRREVSDVDHFYGVSAARTEDRAATDRGTLPVPAGSAQRFAVTVDGDCMEPKYRDGDSVIFSVDAVEREGIIDGRNYFVQFTDGQNTFKRLFLDPENREQVILRCWNENYPQRVVERTQIKLLARAVYKLTPDE